MGTLPSVSSTTRFRVFGRILATRETIGPEGVVGEMVGGRPFPIPFTFAGPVVAI